jgi:hypothetical protein
MKFVRDMFTSKGMDLRDMCQKVLWRERRSRRGWPRPARSTTGYALCSLLNMADGARPALSPPTRWARSSIGDRSAGGVGRDAPTTEDPVRASASIWLRGGAKLPLR